MFSKVKVFNAVGPTKLSRGFEVLEVEDGQEFSIENQFVSVALNENGLLKSVTDKKTMEFLPVHLDFVRYLARQGKERSGAYLFLPDGEAHVVKVEFPLIRFYEGPLFSRVEVRLHNVKHFLIVHHSHDLHNLGVDVINVVDITREDNYELAMRLTSHVKNGGYFYTDLNGLQMTERQTLVKLPIQGNFYPMPTASYIEDGKARLTILSAQPLGVASLKEGELEVLQDRRLKQDDNRGLGQGVLDNKVTSNVFRILIERRLEGCNGPPSLISTNAYLSSQRLLNPLVKMVWKNEVQSGLRNSYSPVGKELPYDVHLLSVRTFDEEVNPSAGFVFHRPHVDFCFVGSESPSDGIINVASFLPNNFGDEIKKSTLSFMRQEEKMSKAEDILLCHMDFLALILS